MAFQQEIYLARYDSNPGTGGAGTWASPYYAALQGDSESNNAARFDGIMNDPSKVPPGSSVRLLPGTFFTTGHSGGNTGNGWAATNGTRMVGSGMGVTTLQLTGVTSGSRYVVGTNFAAVSSGGTYLDKGFELSDLTLECALINAGSNSNVGAILMRGRHIYIRRVQVFNYGTNNAANTVKVITIGGENGENCVLEECVLAPYPDDHTGKAIWFSFEDPTGTNGHRFCAIRNCAGQGIATHEPPPNITTRPYAAIAPGIGLGTIIEGNQFANVYYGVYASQQPAKDIVVWNNYFRNVQTGIRWDQQSAAAVGRIIAQENIIEISRAIALPVGLQFKGSSPDRFGDLVIRRNILRQVADSAHSLRTDATGVDISRCARLIVENNLINDTADTGTTRPVYTADCGSFKFFNNQNDSGNLQRGYNGTQKVRELADAVEGGLLPL